MTIEVAAHIGREDLAATAVTSDRHAARLVFQNASEQSDALSRLEMTCSARPPMNPNLAA
jgi:hypothetical protein